MPNTLENALRSALHRGMVIPAHPLALTKDRRLDERRQRALTRYYSAAGAGGIAVGVHTTQFAIRDPRIGLFQPVLELAAETMVCAGIHRPIAMIRIGGICGKTEQAVREAEWLHRFKYHVGLLSLAALRDASDEALISHCRAVAEIIPIMGFYLQPSVGGRPLSYSFWRRFVEIENVVAIKVAPFNRYQTLDVVRAVVEGGRSDIALYTGNDDTIVSDLLTPYSFSLDGEMVERRFSGGLLGHWAVWTQSAVGLLAQCHHAVVAGFVPAALLQRSVEVTDSNGAFFDAAHGFSGCIAGLHEVLRRQGLLEGVWCLDPNEGLSPGQAEAIDRVYRMYPHLNDDAFVAAHRDEWMK